MFKSVVHARLALSVISNSCHKKRNLCLQSVLFLWKVHLKKKKKALTALHEHAVSITHHLQRTCGIIIRKLSLTVMSE